MNRNTTLAVGFLGTTVAAFVAAFVVNLGIGTLLGLPDGAKLDRPTAPLASPDTDGVDNVSAARPMPVRPPRGDLLQSVLCRSLMDPSVAGQNCGPSEQGVEGQMKTDLRLTLLGTVVAEPANFSSALIVEDGKDGALGYGIGDKIYDAEVVAIEKKLVKLKRANGNVEVLEMEEGSRPAPTSGGADEESDGDEDVRKDGEDSFVVSKDLFNKYINDMEALAGMGRALLHRGPDGQFDGYRLSAIRRNTLADKLGIRNGDIVHSVNGQSLNSMQGAMEAYNTLQSQNEFTFEVTRRGQKKTMTYRLE